MDDDFTRITALLLYCQILRLKKEIRSILKW